MKMNPEILDIMVCPITKEKLEYSSSTNELISKGAGLAFPIKDGIPIMLVSEARKINTPCDLENADDESS